MFNDEITDEKPWRVLPGTFGDSINNIKFMENFIDKNDLLSLQDFVKKIDEWDNSKESEYHEDGTIKYGADVWLNRTCSSYIVKRLDRNIYDLIDFYIDKMTAEINKNYNCIVEKRPPVIVCWRPGDFQVPHADKQLQDGRPNAFPDYDINSLFYINDDYIGGELYFPLQDIQIKPKKGAAYFFPGDKNYIHGVTKVEEGIRYTCPFFWTILEHTGDKKP